MKSDNYVIIISLNGLDIADDKKSIMYKKSELALFNDNWKERKLLNDDVELARYLKKELDVDLNAKHMRFKDRNFFYNPVLTITFKDTSRESLYQKAPKIALSVYTFIRLIDFLNYKGWKSFTCCIVLTKKSCSLQKLKFLGNYILHTKDILNLLN
jgi:hypothetical protein